MDSLWILLFSTKGDFQPQHQHHGLSSVSIWRYFKSLKISRSERTKRGHSIKNTTGPYIPQGDVMQVYQTAAYWLQQWGFLLNNILCKVSHLFNANTAPSEAEAGKHLEFLRKSSICRTIILMYVPESQNPNNVQGFGLSFLNIVITHYLSPIKTSFS